METTLTSLNENHEHTPRTIELSILLKRLQHEGTSLDPSRATAYFSIKGVRFIGSHCPWPTPSIYTTASPDDPRRYAVQVLKEVPNQTYCDAHTFQHDSNGQLVSHTIVHTEHIVNIDGKWNLSPGSATCMARTIRVALQFPFASTVGPYITDLWMSIDMSDSFECTLPYKSVSDRSSPQRIDGVGSEDISYNSCEDEDEDFTPSLTAKGATVSGSRLQRESSFASSCPMSGSDVRLCIDDCGVLRASSQFIFRSDHHFTGLGSSRAFGDFHPFTSQSKAATSSQLGPGCEVIGK